MKRSIEIAAPIILLVVLAFLVGFVAQDVGASRGNPKEIAAKLSLVPDRLQTLVNPSGLRGSGLPVVRSYYDVLGQLRENYYGKKISDRELTYDAIRGMLQALDDPYTRFLDPDSYKQMREENEGNFVGIGAQLDVSSETQQVYVKEPLPGSPAEKAGVKAGDVIIKVDGEAIAGLDIDEVVKKIRGEEKTNVKLSLLRGKEAKPVEVTITRRVVEFRMVSSKMLDETSGIGYIRLYQFNQHSDSQFDSALTQLEKQKMKGLILDLRQNPGGLLQVAVDIGSRFIRSGPIVIIKERTGQKESLDVKKSKHNHREYPLVVLVDKQSASASEIVAGAIKDNEMGTIVGTTTFGKAKVQTITTLTDGSAISITTAKYLTPKGTDINKVGVEPDIVIEAKTEEGKEAFELGDPEEDVQLIKAMDVMKTKLAGGRIVSQPAK